MLGYPIPKRGDGLRVEIGTEESLFGDQKEEANDTFGRQDYRSRHYRHPTS